ncbi:hypothetical protein DPMN_043808 [Dreissena polymorpha]|uniref:Uncharacterized protein n=1 Tax=Dreissena polymorpha TaxID=45954 RepID=A0A9D4D3G6_DREPO|nr:hypothetical protein DPMN_043808 [Dreissena polymorpha]
MSPRTVFCVLQGDQNTFDTYAQTMLHGNGSNRWFDISFNLVVWPNGRVIQLCPVQGFF